MANWIASAIQHPGSFTKKAQAAGKSVSAFASEKAGSSGTIGKQARLAQTLKGFSHKRGKRTAGDQADALR